MNRYKKQQLNQIFDMWEWQFCNKGIKLIKLLIWKWTAVAPLLAYEKLKNKVTLKSWKRCTFLKGTFTF